jgi:photosystem II stability/assembly factor-like uncharacterized protein
MIALLSAAQPATAQWVCNGPFGASVLHTIDIGGDTYAATNVGIFKTSDNAQTWTGVSVTPLGPFGSNIIYYDGTTMWAGVSQEGVFKSSDLGVHWVDANNADLGNPYGVLGIVEHNGSIVVACSEGYFSTNNQGTNWTPLANPITSFGPLYSFGGDLFTHSILDSYHRVYKSTDNGASWDTASTGMGTHPYVKRMYEIGGDLYAVTSSNIFKSTNGGASWTQLNTNTPSGAIGPNCISGNTVFGSEGGNTNVQVWKMDLAGTTWIDITNNLPDGQTESMFAIGSEVFISKDGSLWKTSDGGSTWINTGNVGMSGQPIWSLMTEGSLVVAGGYQNTYRSQNDGSTWSTTLNVASYANIHGLGRVGSNLVAATAGDGIYLSPDDGQTWPTHKLSSQYFYDLASDGTSILAAGDMIYRSTDGNTWSSFETGKPANTIALSIHIVGSDAFSGLGVTAPPFDDAGVWTSPTTAANWIQKSNGLNMDAPACFAHHGGRIFAGGFAVYETTDGGDNWTTIGLSGLEVKDLIATNSHLVAATDSGIYRMNLDSTTWVDISGNLLVRDVNALAVNSDFLFAGTSTGSVWQTPSTLVGIDDLILPRESVRMAPNPAVDNLTITFTGDRSSLQLFDVTGRVVLRQADLISGSSIDVSALAPGVYMAQVHHQDVLSVMKLVMR